MKTTDVIQINTARNNNYIVVFDKIKGVEFHTRRLPLPSYNIGKTIVSSRYDVDYSEPGEKIDYMPFSLQYVVDENLNNYKEIFDWIHNLLENPEDKTDARLIIYNNSGNKIRELLFQECWPMDHQEIDYSTNDDGMELIATCIFNYTKFVFVD